MSKPQSADAVHCDEQSVSTLRTLAPAPGASDATVGGEATGTRQAGLGRDVLLDFDDYEILEELARGGMGVVYRARQRGLNRDVAVKMILSRQFAGEAELRRFQAEAEAVARLQHPNIVQIYGVGDAGGQPYLSLEYVAGGSLAQKLAGTPQSAREAAALVETLARAVHDAHRHGIIHRDLKPANVLLTSEGIPKIADFGLAKQVEGESSETRTGAILGTPSYMAPEQAAGSAKEAGPLADVYALGAILYEALTGRPPFRAESPTETLVQVLEDEPVPARQLRPKLPRDLQTIAMKCLEKAPHRRYASAQDLADDLRRFLDGRPIRGRPVRAWERTVKWARRRPTAAGLVVVSIAAALALVLGGAWYNSQLQTALGESRRNLQTAQTNLGVAHGAINRMLERVADDLAPVPHTEEVRRRLLRDALEFYRATVRHAAGDPEGRTLLAGAYLKLGDIHRLLGSSDEALQEYGRAIDAAGALIAQSPGQTEYVVILAGARNNRANLLINLGRTDEAEADYREALALLEPLVDGEDAELEKQTARIDNNLGVLLSGRGMLAEAQAAHSKALELRLRLVRRFPDEIELRTDLATSYSNLGILRWKQKQHAQAAEALQQADRLFHAADPRLLSPEQQSAWARVRSNLGSVLSTLRRGPDAERAFQQAVDLESKLAAECPAVPAFRSDLAGMYANLGRQQAIGGKSSAARHVFQEACRLYDALAAEFPADEGFRAEAAQCRRLLAILEADNQPPHGKQ